MKTPQEMKKEFLKKWDESHIWEGGPFGSLTEVYEDKAEFALDENGIADYWLSVIEARDGELRNAIENLDSICGNGNCDCDEANYVEKSGLLSLLDHKPTDGVTINDIVEDLWK